MKILDTPLKDLLLFQPHIFSDNRGAFVKNFSAESFANHGIDTHFVESFYSISHKGVIRGMHFQTPPCACAKLVFVSRGAILDIVVDLRRNSATQGAVFSTILDAKNHHCLFIPKGFAHGFLALKNHSQVHYAQDCAYNALCDSGIAHDSIDFNWQKIARDFGIENFTLSPRDSSFESLKNFLKKGLF